MVGGVDARSVAEREGEGEGERCCLGWREEDGEEKGEGKGEEEAGEMHVFRLRGWKWVFWLSGCGCCVDLRLFGFDLVVWSVVWI